MPLMAFGMYDCGFDPDRDPARVYGSWGQSLHLPSPENRKLKALAHQGGGDQMRAVWSIIVITSTIASDLRWFAGRNAFEKKVQVA